MDCLAQFGLNIFTDVCLHALAHLSRCAHWLGNGHSNNISNIDSNGSSSDNISIPTVSPTPSSSSTGDNINTSPNPALPFIYHVDDSSSDLTVWLCTLRAMAQMVS